MKRAVLAVIGTAAALVLLLGFKSHAVTTRATPPAALSTPADNSQASPIPQSNAGSSQAPSSSAQRFTGSTVQTRYGPVQIEISVNDQKISAVQALQVPSDRERSVEISQFAVPELIQETIAAQSANIDMVSGATYTSQGYETSLQSALDQAGLR